MSQRRSGDEISPALVQLVENNLLLQQAITDLKHIKAVQEMNHIVSLELRDHQTIQRVDRLWSVVQTVTNVRWLFAAVGAVLAALYVIHSIWKWPQ